MASNHAKTIKGLSIGCIAFSAATLLICVIAAFLCAATIEVLRDNLQYSLMQDSYYNQMFNMDGLSDLYGLPYGFDAYNGQNAASEIAGKIGIFGMQVLVFVCILEAVLQIVSVAAGVITLANCDKPSKLGMVFGWSIAGSVVAFLSSNLVLGAMFVLMSVFSYRARKMASSGEYFANAPSGGRAV